jgi:hypothetical protein
LLATDLEYFQEKHAPGLIGGGIPFSVRKCDSAKMLERFLFPANVKPLWSEIASD